MLNQNTTVLAPSVERARKILQHEQRTNHQDQAIRPGGLEAFTARWYDEASALCQQSGLDSAPLRRFVTLLTGYRQQDPMQRASTLRAALALLNEIDGQSPGSSSLSAPVENNSAPPSENSRSSPASSSSDYTPKHAKKMSAPISLEETEPHPEPAFEVGRPLQSPPPSPPNSVRLEAGMTTGHTSLTLLRADITAIPGVGPSAATRLHALGLRTIQDLLFYFPREHRDYSQLTKIGQIPFNELVTTMGLIWDVKLQRTANGRSRTIAEISDETGKLYASWFNQSYLQKQLNTAKGSYIVVTGEKRRFGNKVEFSVRSHELPEQGDLLSTGRLVPIYPLTEGLHAKTMRRYTKWVVDRYAQIVPEHLPASIRHTGNLIPLSEAISHIHYPESEEMRAAAHRRLAFDELFIIQLGMQERRSRWAREAKQGNAFLIDTAKIFIEQPNEPALAAIHRAQPAPRVAAAPTLGATLWSVFASDEPFEATLPFTFTPAQRRVICEIFADLARSRPMSRLLQGDVGAGKTAVAAAALLMAALNGYQGAIMAPTELLAEQHARSISKMLEPFGIHTVLLTGSQKQRERSQARSALESGQAAVAIGTHALIQEDVIFSQLGLVIVDEQHRFGVEQRDALRQKGNHPHMLVMTATPIPRTLALTLYGDLDVSAIDQLPPGRQKIITRWRTGARRSEAYTTIAHQVAEGRQAFIICPLIEESDSLAAKAAVSEHERLQREVFPNLRLGLLHGGMKAQEKDEIMHRFRDHQLDILVATSVIEVGIDVPNATVMVIEDADRFGLSQLHQFRGRVGRGKHQSYCYVLSADASMQAQDRLGVFQETTDGFRLAEEDLRLRGPGDFIGVRQSGMPEMQIADLSDTVLIEQARTLSGQLWESDPYLRKPEHAPLREKMHLFWQQFMAH
ncbi:ATP-dependent DNA helicase RecG [Tengunoibacter tsumagoiensis]|uniref:ATP-dependent DNA helicase RecG n=1 Tax=Tengunoibacter tsumagoiensis TaxID=2014871 RepID=A0A402A486_9CHLR|nr:ATP-dependent DNA helicase RecG [Tengunoibacter tsumagoiensis]GCE13953.1 ATP-dependent DNA helicase RecG [Tengunoibacter tsumagoiensis]